MMPSDARVRLEMAIGADLSRRGRPLLASTIHEIVGIAVEAGFVIVEPNPPALSGPTPQGFIDGSGYHPEIYCAGGTR
jgi:hypothetical protein